MYANTGSPYPSQPSVAAMQGSLQQMACTMPSAATNPIVGSPSMSGLRYDAGTYHTHMRQSVGPGQYVLAPLGPNCTNCLAGDTRIAQGTSGVATCGTASFIDVESDLHNLSRRATLDPGGMYRGNGGPPQVCGAGAGSSGAQLVGAAACDGIPTVDTRLANPPCTLRGTGWNRWEWLCTDPQARALMPFDFNVDTSIIVKDNHRPHVARLVDPTLALPPGKADRNASIGAPQWMPQLCNGVGAVDESPNLLWRSCAEVDRIQHGCRSAA